MAVFALPWTWLAMGMHLPLKDHCVLLSASPRPVFLRVPSGLLSYERTSGHRQLNDRPRDHGLKGWASIVLLVMFLIPINLH